MPVRLFFFLLFLAVIYGIPAAGQALSELADPVVDGIWLRPAPEQPAKPIWGFDHGLRVGLAPLPGPRGLLRIYTPYLNQEALLNFIAMEPIPEGQDGRGFSELERSDLDNVRGKRFWSSNDSTDFLPHDPDQPARGVITRSNGISSLTVFIFSEPFDNGANVYIRLRFLESRPHEVELTTYSYAHSVPLKNFILTATMGNYARLRRLILQDTVLTSSRIWPEYRENDFTRHFHVPEHRMIGDAHGNTFFIATPDEKDPRRASYADDTSPHWKYEGEKAIQYWKIPHPSPDTEGLVNGRYVYWASTSPIPGGIAFENFEIKEEFRQGNRVIFGVSPDTPTQFIDSLKRTK